MRADLHDRRLGELMNRGCPLGIEGIVMRGTEIKIYDEHRLIYEIDGLLIDRSGWHHLIEYKCNYGLKDKAHHQLRIAEEWYRNNHMQRPYLYFVYGPKFEYEPLRGLR